MADTVITATLLDTKPVSGSIVERHFGRPSSTCTWVQVCPADADPWIGVFADAEVAYFSGVAVLPQVDAIVVVARGQGYVINATSGTLLRTTSWSYAYSLIAAPGHDFAVAADTCAIWAVGLEADTTATLQTPWWQGEDRIALDGIVFEEISSRTLVGKAWLPDGWHPFELSLDTLEVQLGGVASKEWNAYYATPGGGGFPTPQAYYDWMSQYWLA